MAPEAKLSKVYQWALVVDEQELRRLVDECRRSIVEGTNVTPDSVVLELEVKFSDGLSYKPETLEDILAEENPRGRSIFGLGLVTSTDGASIACKFASEHQGASSITVESSNRDWVYVTLSRIEERLRRMKQWHGRVRNLTFPLCIAAAVVRVGMLAIATKRFPDLLEVKPDGNPLIVLVIVLSLLVSLLGTILIATTLFPDPVFRIGDGVVRHDRAKSARSKLGWALLAACVLTPIVRALSVFVW